MIPVKDNIPRERFPLVTAVLIAIDVTAFLLARADAPLPFLLDVLFLGLLAPSVEGALGRPRFCALCLLSGVLVGGAWALAGDGWPSPVLLGTSGATLIVLGSYLLLHPRARVLSLVPIPFFTTLVEVPAALLIGLWLALQLYFGVVGLG
ncbi:MAG TPA: rhomboid family intramembrane serine protease [Solirubrobacteraceae bacterium]